MKQKLYVYNRVQWLSPFLHPTSIWNQSSHLYCSWIISLKAVWPIIFPVLFSHVLSWKNWHLKNKLTWRFNDFLVLVQCSLEEHYPCVLFRNEDEGSSFLWNSGNILLGYMASHLRKQNLHSHCHENPRSPITGRDPLGLNEDRGQCPTMKVALLQFWAVQWSVVIFIFKTGGMSEPRFPWLLNH